MFSAQERVRCKPPSRGQGRTYFVWQLWLAESCVGDEGGGGGEPVPALKLTKSHSPTRDEALPRPIGSCIIAMSAPHSPSKTPRSNRLAMVLVRRRAGLTRLEWPRCSGCSICCPVDAGVLKQTVLGRWCMWGGRMAGQTSHVGEGGLTGSEARQEVVF